VSDSDISLPRVPDAAKKQTFFLMDFKSERHFLHRPAHSREHDLIKNSTTHENGTGALSSCYGRWTYEYFNAAETRHCYEPHFQFMQSNASSVCGWRKHFPSASADTSMDI